MRGYVFLAAFLASASRVASHPLCYVDDRPTDTGRQHTFCPAAQDGACCNAAEEDEIQLRFEGAGTLSDDCADLYKQLVCGQCHSYSNHLFGRLGPELGVMDGLTMKKDFCEELVDRCSGQGNIVFPSYGGDSYCKKHTGGGSDLFWAYPYTEPEIFEPGLNKYFGELGDDDFPDQCITVKQSPDGSMFWLVGQAGEIKKVDADDMGKSSTVVDISGGGFYLEFEEGLLDVAFGPMFGKGYDVFYLSYTVQLGDGKKARNRLSKFQYFAGDATKTRDSEEVLLTTAPKASNIHAAGWCDFPPSAYGKSGDQDLYWTTGDGGGQTDPDNNGQDTSNLLGAVIRISVSPTESGYRTPGGNIAGEICSSGFRNPWRCGFDDGDVLYCGDVGHTMVEEIDIVECGKNYGWNIFEGSRCQEDVEYMHGDCSKHSRGDYVFPYFEYCHPDYDSKGDSFAGGYDLCGSRQLIGHAVIGGYVYRGEYFADLLDGAYIFGDATNRNVYYIREVDGEMTLGTIISDGSVQIIGFAKDKSGEIMMIDRAYDIWQMPCGDLCASTCLEQSEEQPTFESLGCYNDVFGDRALPKMAGTCKTGASAMSAGICASYCATLGSAYSAVQFGSECFCGGEGADYGRHGKTSSDNCNMLCSATPDEFCGGNLAMEVFELGAPAATVEPVDPIVPDPDPKPPTDASYMGCYVDMPEPNRVMMPGSDDPSSKMTAEMCSGICVGYAFYAMQYGYECWCSSAEDYDMHGDGVCDIACTGDSGVMCGGNYAMSVYANDGGVDQVDPEKPVEPPTDPSYVGCYADQPEPDRAMMPGTVDPNFKMTAKMCAGICAGYAYYGMQYGYECWCSSTDDYDVHGDGVCNMACAGDGDEICGGYYSISVYENDVEVEPVDSMEPPTDPDYIGCYADMPEPDRAMMPGSVDPSSKMTAETCSGICAGYAYYGLQYGYECWCSSADDYDVHGDGVCNMACAGDGDEICGGYFSISVYENDVEAEPVDPSYIGCYADVEGVGRAMAYGGKDDAMTAETCSGICAGYAFFGTQYGYECWCSQTSDYDVHGDGTCDIPCKGNGDEMCGGDYSISVYSNGGDGGGPAELTDDSAYLGCFADDFGSRVFGVMKIEKSMSMTTEECKGACSGYDFFATQWGWECWCGSEEDYKKHGEGVCDYPCPGDAQQTCGGYYAMSVYTHFA